MPQKPDKYVGVMFGIKLEETYKAAWEKVDNPPILNIWVPTHVKKKQEQELDAEIYN